MKRQLILISLMAMGLGFSACSNDSNNEEVKPGIPEGTADVTIQENNIDVTSAPGRSTLLP